MVISGLIFLLVFGLLALTQFLSCLGVATDRQLICDRTSALMPDLLSGDTSARNVLRATGPPGILTALARIRGRADMSSALQQSVDEYDLQTQPAPTAGSDC